jgi:hypothetical protein
MLVVRSAGDEASLALATAEALVWAWLRTTTRLVRLAEKLAAWHPMSLAMKPLSGDEPKSEMSEMIRAELHGGVGSTCDEEEPEPMSHVGWGDWLIEVLGATLAAGVAAVIYYRDSQRWLDFLHAAAGMSCVFSVTFFVVAVFAGLSGPEFMRWAVHVQATAEAAPDGDVLLFQAPRGSSVLALESSEAEFFDLAHSSSYRDRSVAERIMGFVEQLGVGG